MTHETPRTVDFFACDALPAPRISGAEARRIAALLGAGVSAGVSAGTDAGVDASTGIGAGTDAAPDAGIGPGTDPEPLGSQQDANFLLRSADGTPEAVLKVANPAFGPAEIQAQDAAADLLAAAHAESGDLRAATVLRDDAGARRIATVETADGPTTARLLRFLPGGTLSGSRHLPPKTVAAMGRVVGRVSRTLSGFEHPGLDRVLQWDPRFAARVVGMLLGHVAEPERRAAVEAAATRAWADLQKVADALPLQAVHLDLTDDNLVRSPGSRPPLPDGVIDFGDLTTSWAVAELAISVSSLLHHSGMEPCHVLPAVRAFHAVRPLSAEEVAALWPLVVLRGATLVVSGRQQAAVDGDNAYVNGALEREWRIFEQAVSVPSAVMTHLIADAVGLAAPRFVASNTSPMLPASSSIAVLDLSTEADAMDRGAWLEPGSRTGSPPTSCWPGPTR